MPFAPCPACDRTALVDPSGRCPEGHLVALATVGGDATAPPRDEPVPWTRAIRTSDLPGEPAEPRAAVPPSGPAAVPDEDGVDADGTADLLQELHALSDLAASAPPVTPFRRVAPAPPVVEPAPPVRSMSEGAPASGEVPAPIETPATPEPPTVEPIPATAVPAPPSVSHARPAPPSSPEEATDLDELTSLAAAMGALDHRAGTAVPPRTGEANAVTGRQTEAPPTDPLVDIVATRPAPTTAIDPFAFSAKGPRATTRSRSGVRGLFRR